MRPPHKLAVLLSVVGIGGASQAGCPAGVFQVGATSARIIGVVKVGKGPTVFIKGV